jgi:hypothetical protein
LRESIESSWFKKLCIQQRRNLGNPPGSPVEANRNIVTKRLMNANAGVSGVERDRLRSLGAIVARDYDSQRPMADTMRPKYELTTSMSPIIIAMPAGAPKTVGASTAARKTASRNPPKKSAAPIQKSRVKSRGVVRPLTRVAAAR